MAVSRARARRFDPAFEFVADTVSREPAVPIAALAVATGDSLLRSEVFTAAEAPAPDPLTAFPVASITKPIVATAVMQLVERGVLVLTTPVVEYLPGFQPPAASAGEPGGEMVTAWHLLTHTSGLTDIDLLTAAKDRLTANDYRRSLRERPLAFAPGSAYAYCSDSFYILAELIERFTGLPYPAALGDRIFEPLSMRRTGFDPATLDCPSSGLLGIDPFTDDPETAVRTFISLALPGGGLWSTTEDLVAFGQAMARQGERSGGRVLAPAFVELMTREQTGGVREAGIPPREPHYALGWDRPTLDARMPGSAGAFGHSGASGSRLWIDPANDLVIVFLMNCWGASDRWWRGAVAAVYGELG